MTAPRVGAILLVGGRSTRMGGGFKPLIEIGGTSLFARSVMTLADAGTEPIIAAGPELDEAAPVHWVREDPPFAGPVAGIAAALAALDAGISADGPAAIPEWMLVLAGDLPHVAGVVDRLLAVLTASAAGPDADADADAAAGPDAHVFTADGHPQWLAGVYRTDALRSALRALAAGGTAYDDASCRSLFSGLDIAWLTDEDGITADIDTPADLVRIRAELEEES